MIFGNSFKTAWAEANGKAKEAVAALTAEAETVVVKIIVRSVFVPIKAISAVGNAYSSIKAFFSNNPASSPIQACMSKPGQGAQLSNSITSWKKLIAKAKLAQEHCPNIKNEDIGKLQKQVNDSEKAFMAKDVYNSPPGGDVPGWTRVSDEELKEKPVNLDPNTFHPKDSEFRAALYKSDDVPPKYCLAFKGTTASSRTDWENNILQGLGLETDYYRRAELLARKAFKATKGALEVTGHSLGGGLASAAAASVGVDGATFNAAGLSQDTIPGMNREQMKKQIDVYQVKGEPLTLLEQKGFGPDAVGTKHPIDARSEDGLIDKHSMECVMYGMEQHGIPLAHKLDGELQDCVAGR